MSDWNTQTKACEIYSLENVEYVFSGFTNVQCFVNQLGDYIENLVILANILHIAKKLFAHCFP